MQNTWLCLLPPLIALTCVFITKRLITSLLIGIGTAAFIAKEFNPVTAIALSTQRIGEQLIDIPNLLLYGFSFAIGLLIVTINKTGGALAFTRAVTKHIKTSVHAQTTSILLSFALFIDDYLSNLTVGYVMRPLTDTFKIPRAKLAFLVHSLSGPFVVLIPISSWGAIIMLQLARAHISPLANATTSIIASPLFLYMQTIPFIFYSLMTIIGVWFIVFRNISFGPMHEHEKAAQQGDFFGGKPPIKDSLSAPTDQQGSMADFIIPIVSLLFCTTLGMLIIKPSTPIETFALLFISSLIALGISIIRSLFYGSLKLSQLPAMTREGIHMMYGALLIVMLASTLGGMLETDLKAGNYLASLILGKISLTFLPFIFFLIAAVVAVILGSAWGTIALLVPIAIPMVIALSGTATPAFLAALPALLPVLGAVLSGAVAGNHVSPISDTTIMAATSSGSTPLDHAYTQLPYAIPMLVSTGLAFICAGILAPYGLLITWTTSFALGITTNLGLLYAGNRWYKKHQK